MNRTAHTLCWVCAVLAVARSADPAPSAKDLERLQGEWTVVSIEAEGETLREAAFKGVRFVFKKDRLTFTKDKPAPEKPAPEEKTAKVKLDGSKSPKWINIVAVTGLASDEVLGIYSLDRDELRICLSRKGKDRPKGFATKAGVEHGLYVLKRHKP